jgi:hypothetical protein
MKLRALIVLTFACLALAGCIVEPYGGNRGYYGGEYDHDYGRRVWHE